MNLFPMTATFAAGALAVPCATQTDGSVGPAGAVARWSSTALARQLDAEMEELLRYAGRAPSSHKAQPWRIEPAGPRSLRLLADRSRYLPAVDPTNREMLLSFGAFLETLDQAAQALGHGAEVTVTAGSLEATEIAVIRVNGADAPRDPRALNLIASTYTPKARLGTGALDQETLEALGVSPKGALRCLPSDSPEFRWVREEVCA